MSNATRSLLCLIATLGFCVAFGPQPQAHAQYCPQTAKLIADDPSGHRFGTSVSFSGSSIAIGAPNDSGAAGIAGAAYVFRDGPAGWSQLRKLTVPTPLGQLGRVVSISGTDVVAGAHPTPPALTGAAYRFILGSSHPPDPLIPNPVPNHQIGYAVAVDGDTAVVTAPNYNSTGAAYVYDLSAMSVPPQQLFHPNSPTARRFGHAAAVDGDRIAVSALDTSSNAGSVVIFDRPGGWPVTRLLKNGSGQVDERFGYSVDVSDGTVVVGAPYHDRPNGQSRAGAVYVFGPDGDRTVLKVKDVDTNDQFGYSVSIHGDVMVVGAPTATGNSGNSGGAAYVFRYFDGAWRKACRIFADDGGSGEQFGTSVAIEGSAHLGGRVVIGAPDHQLPGAATGAVYVFRFGGLGTDGPGADEPDPKGQ